MNMVLILFHSLFSFPLLYVHPLPDCCSSITEPFPEEADRDEDRGSPRVLCAAIVADGFLLFTGGGKKEKGASHFRRYEQANLNFYKFHSSGFSFRFGYGFSHNFTSMVAAMKKTRLEMNDSDPVGLRRRCTAAVHQSRSNDQEDSAIVGFDGVYAKSQKGSMADKILHELLQSGDSAQQEAELDTLTKYG
ncbi:hypothetical protein COLO4_32188 [Corchorus olitorius]|uniref:Uncharacterized protein n=1 Tax=Corchorus olitorius TaxID=93759 RepID=A0A1R3H0H6_9ROSI|nr:hypothetical protein COLO4_32188 [Corchorus olitorius]